MSGLRRGQVEFASAAKSLNLRQIMPLGGAAARLGNALVQAWCAKTHMVDGKIEPALSPRLCSSATPA
jgi:hypothetical protein